ncbi:sulfurtransferase [Gordonia sp. NPDC058843]|uniref:sulfurtransferase n=1 Tax=Gordonia sp. NPDC058843 TaxID=3346648 RepID=UPI00367E66B1
MTTDVRSPLISARELYEELNAPSHSTRVLDVRWSLTEPDGSEAYAAGHIPGAVYVDLETDLSDHSIPGRGRHPLPSGRDLQAALRRWGVDDGSRVVLYDDWNAAGSSRGRWVLLAAGLTDVVVLDGGWRAWTREGLPVHEGPVVPDPGSVHLTYDDLDSGVLRTLTPDETLDLAARGRLLDARAPERFSGAAEPIDPVAGHIPGARNLPFTSVLTADGTFGTPDAIREAVSQALGSPPPGGVVGAYCGSGVTAAVLLTALEHAGHDATALYPGSWSEWASSGREVETGP